MQSDKEKIINRYSFGNDVETADELAELVAKGIKTATCWRYIEGETLPQLQELSIIENSKGDEVCMVETIVVEIVPFNQVSAEFAYLEGERDRSLESWRDIHKNYFIKEGYFSEDMLLACERFKLVK